MPRKSASTASDELGEIYRLHGRSLRAITRKAGEGEAADLAQDACLKLVETQGREVVRAPANLLFRIARNLVIDRLRSQTQSKKVFSPSPAHLDYPSLAPDPEHALLAGERLRRALAMIEAMPQKRREVFLLHRLENLSYGKIASRLGISVKTVEKHMSAAMAQLSVGMRNDD